MKNIIIAIFCLLFTVTSFSQKGDAEYQKIVKEYTLNTDGSIDYHYSKSLKLLSHFAFHRLYGETFIIYNTNFQELKINSSYTIMADGKKIIAPNNAFNQVLPRFSNNSPAYNHIREMVVTHTGLEVGATINLDYNLHSASSYFPALMGDEILEESSPVKELVIRVKIPAGSTLNYAVLNTNSNPVVTNKGGQQVFTWTFSSLPASSKDSNQDSDHTTIPRLIFSTIDLQGAYSSFMNQEAFDYMTNESMTKAVEDIQAKENDELKTILAIQKLVSNNLSNLSIPLEYTGFKCRNSITTWNSNQGTELEMAILMTSLLRKANFNAEPVAVVPISLYNKEVGNLLAFNDFIVKVNLKKIGDIYLSSNHIDNQNQRFYLGKDALFPLDKSRTKFKVTFAKTMTSEIALNAQFDLQNSGKLLGNISVELKNGSNPYFRIYNDSSKVNSTIRGISGKDVATHDIDKLSQEECKFNLTIDKESPTTVNGNYHSFLLPVINNGVDSWRMNTLTAERSSPVELPQLINEKYEYVIVLPEGSKLVTKQVLSIVNHDIGSVTVKLEQKGNEVIIEKEISFKTKTISFAEYPKFKQIMDIWNNDKYREILFKK